MNFIFPLYLFTLLHHGGLLHWRRDIFSTVVVLIEIRFCLWQGKAVRINSSVAETRCAEPQISNSGLCLESNWKQAVISYREQGVDETTRHAQVSHTPRYPKPTADALVVTFHLRLWTSSQVFPQITRLHFLRFPPVSISHLVFFPHRQVWACITDFLSHVEDVQ